MISIIVVVERFGVATNKLGYAATGVCTVHRPKRLGDKTNNTERKGKTMASQTGSAARLKRVKLGRLETRPAEFQFRHQELDAQHVRDLARVAKQGNELDPMTAWEDPDSGSLVIVDGHHRFAAYKSQRWAKAVPVRVHRCSKPEALALALEENQKARLQLTQEERLDAAWRLVCTVGNHDSVRGIAEKTSVSKRTVSNMRSTKLELESLDPDEPLPERWREALDELKGIEGRVLTEDEREEMIRAQAKQLDAKIGKTLGDAAKRQVEATAEVVAFRLGRQGLSYLIENHAYKVAVEVVGQFGPDEFMMEEDEDIDDDFLERWSD